MTENGERTTDIEVDEAAAYFGVTASSDTLHAMMAMPRESAMIQFFELLSDIVLLPGEFDFEAASKRMQCEGGEIYYLVAGHLGLMTMADPLLHILGLPDSSGEIHGAKSANISADQEAALTSLADPMRIIKLFAVAHQTGGGEEVTNYLSTLEGLFATPENSISAFVSIKNELDAALDVVGHVLPIETLASGNAAASTVSASSSTPPAAPKKSVVPLPSSAPKQPEPMPAKEQPKQEVPLPSQTVDLPEITPSPTKEPEVNVENQKQVARATQDAFAGAFDISIGSEEPVETEPIASPEPPIEEPEVATEPVVEPIPEPEVEAEPFVSAAEHFIAADEDGSGALSVEELAVATGSTLEEAKEMHAEADTDGDGTVTLSEFVSSSASEKTASLPRPVAPVRKPLTGPTAPTPAQAPPQPQQAWPQQQPQPQQAWPQQQPKPQQAWPQQQQPPQPGWPQPQPQAPMVQPTIRSGVQCRGCGIGLDPYWRFCPICGQQNLGY